MWLEVGNDRGHRRKKTTLFRWQETPSVPVVDNPSRLAAALAAGVVEKHERTTGL